MPPGRTEPFCWSWWLRRRTPAALALAVLIAFAVFTVIAGLSKAPASEAARPAVLAGGLLIASHVISALLTGCISRFVQHEQRKALLLTGACICVFLGQIAVVLLPAGDSSFKLETRTSIQFGAESISGENAAPPPSDPADSPAGARQTLAVAVSLAWLGVPVLFLFAWFSGLTAVPSYYALLRQHDAERLRAAQAAQRDAELKLSVLAAQVEPHFLFNTLAGVRGAVASEPALAVAMIDRLAEYLRLTIPRLRDDGRSHQAQLRAQFEIVAAYLALMQARLPRLHYQLELPKALHAAQFPPLMLISLVENAVKHGVEPKAGPAMITVEARRLMPTGDAADGELFEVSVSDDGVGFCHDHGGGVGLTNIRARLAQLYGSAASLSLNERDGGGVQATLRLPLRWQPAPNAVATT